MTIGTNQTGSQVDVIGPGGTPTTTQLPGGNPSNVGSISNSTSTGNNSSNNSSQSTGSSASTGASGSTSFIPDFVQQLNFLNQFGNLAGSLSQQQYNWAQDQFANNSALTNQNINDYLKNSDMGFQGASRDFQNYNDIFTPAADSLTKDWQSYVSPERVSSEMGAAEATQAQAFEGQRKNIERSLESYGINPSDPRYAGAMAANRTAEGASQAAAGTAARYNTENVGRQLRQSALNEAHLLPGQTATEQNVAMQGLTGATNAAFGNTSLGALTMGTTPQYLNAGVANTKFQPLGSVSGSTNQSGSANQSSSVGSSVGSSNSNSSTSPVLNTTPYTGFRYMAEGGAIPEPGEGGGAIPPSMSPSGGQQVDDIPAQIEQTGGAARLNAGEFVIPQDVTEWMGQKFFQDLIMKSRKARMSNPGPAHPTQGPGGEQHVMGGPTAPGAVTGSVSTPGGTAPQGSAGNAQVNGGPDMGAPGAPGGGGMAGGSDPMAPQTAGNPQINGGPDLGSPGAPGATTAPKAPFQHHTPPHTHAPKPGKNPAEQAGGQPNPAEGGGQTAGTPQTQPPAPGGNTATGSTPPAIPPQGGQGQNAPLPMGNQLMEGGDHSVAVQHSTPGAASRLGQGLAAGQQGPGPFTPKPNYFTPPNPFVRQPTPAFTPVPNTPIPAPPTPASVIPPQQPLTLPTATPGTGTPGTGTPGTGTGAPNVGAVGRGMNNDGQLHPMLPNDLDQLLTSGQQIAQQNQALYAKWGIPMPGGVSFGTGNTYGMAS